MARLPILTDAEAGPEAGGVFEASRQMFGRVANAIRVSAASPRMLQPLFGFLLSLCRAEITDVLDARTKALLILKTSMENGCKY